MGRGCDGEHAEGAFRADAVVTFTAPKLAHVFGHLTPGETFGPVVVAEIGSPAEAVQSEPAADVDGSLETTRGAAAGRELE